MAAIASSVTSKAPISGRLRMPRPATSATVSSIIPPASSPATMARAFTSRSMSPTRPVRAAGDSVSAISLTAPGREC